MANDIFGTQEVNGVNSAVTPMRPVEDQSDSTLYSGLKDVGYAVGTAIFNDRTDEEEARKAQTLSNYYTSQSDLIKARQAGRLSAEQAEMKALDISTRFFQENPHLGEDFEKINKTIRGFRVAERAIGGQDPEVKARDELLQEAYGRGMKLDTPEDEQAAISGLQAERAQKAYFDSLNASTSALNAQLETAVKENTVSNLGLQNKELELRVTQKTAEWEAKSAGRVRYVKFNETARGLVSKSIEFLSQPGNDTVQNRQLIAQRLTNQALVIKQELLSSPEYTHLSEAERRDYGEAIEANFKNAEAILIGEKDLKIAETQINSMLAFETVGMISGGDATSKKARRLGAAGQLFKNNPNIFMEQTTLVPDLIDSVKENPDGSLETIPLWASDEKTVQINKGVLESITGTAGKINSLDPNGVVAQQEKEGLKQLWSAYVKGQTANYSDKPAEEIDADLRKGAWSVVEALNSPNIERMIMNDPKALEVLPSEQGKLNSMFVRVLTDPAFKAFGKAVHTEISKSISLDMGQGSKVNIKSFTDVVDMVWEPGGIRIVPKPGLWPEQSVKVQEIINTHRNTVANLTKVVRASALMNGSTDYAKEFEKLKARDLFQTGAGLGQPINKSILLGPGASQSDSEGGGSTTPQPAVEEPPAPTPASSRNFAPIRIGNEDFLLDSEEAVKEFAAGEGFTPAETEMLVDQWRESMARKQRIESGQTLKRGK